MLPSLDECGCLCHRTGAVHIVACCTGVRDLERIVDRNVAGAIARGIMRRARLLGLVDDASRQSVGSSADPA